MLEDHQLRGHQPHELIEGTSHIGQQRSCSTSHDEDHLGTGQATSHDYIDSVEKLYSNEGIGLRAIALGHSEENEDNVDNTMSTTGDAPHQLMRS
eukprot:3500320-Amphidinium_carterae.1